MWLIADSGSTKTEWVLFDSKEKSTLVTSGLNPLFLSGEEFKDKVRKSIPKEWVNKVTKVWFYGAGCGTKNVKGSTTRWLQSVFIKSDIQVDSDLIGAARATCVSDKGIVAIMGTGSNSCVYNGHTIAKQIKPLGFILGDEGSGAALGKLLLKKLLRDQFSPKLTELIYQELKMSYDEIIGYVYTSDWPNRFLASCSKVLYTLKSEPEINALIDEEFNRFVGILKKYQVGNKVNFIGSIAFYFQKNLIEILLQNELELGVILKSPAEALVTYHLANQ